MAGNDGKIPLLDQVKSLIGNSKLESQMKIDPEGKQLQIDDLIIIPNNVTATPPDGGSALQNLAKIASRYQNSSSQQQKSDSSEATAAKKPKLDQDQVPASTAAAPIASHQRPSSATSANAAAAAHGRRASHLYGGARTCTDMSKAGQ